MVRLEPYSTLKYPQSFSGEERKVFLTGEAFFEIERDPLKPFLVFANETITKVLGTSFRVTAYKGQETVDVEVVSGKVAVYANVASNIKGGKKKEMLIEADEQIVVPLPNKKLEVTANQKVIFDKDEEELVKTLSETPQVLKSITTLSKLEFNDDSVIEVFEAIEKAYGVEMNFDADGLKDCTITTKLDSMPLFDKLDIITFALDLDFEVRGTSIEIKGKGCK